MLLDKNPTQKVFLTIIPRAQMGSESMAHEAFHGLLTQRPFRLEE